MRHLPRARDVWVDLVDSGVADREIGGRGNVTR